MPVNEVADNLNKTKDITITEPEPLATCEEEYSIFEDQEERDSDINSNAQPIYFDY